jgi:putative oxidoreductase
MFQRLISTSRTWIPVPIRLALGVIFVAHGAQKVLGYFGGKGLVAFIAGQAPLGLKPAWAWLGAAALAELIGGLLLVLGLMTRLGAFLIACVMVVAMAGVHWSRGFFLQSGGIEYTVALLAMALGLLISGGGMVSMDGALMNGRGRRR